MLYVYDTWDSLGAFNEFLAIQDVSYLKILKEIVLIFIWLVVFVILETYWELLKLFILFLTFFSIFLKDLTTQCLLFQIFTSKSTHTLKFIYFISTQTKNNLLWIKRKYCYFNIKIAYLVKQISNLSFENILKLNNYNIISSSLVPSIRWG